jgi:hypothetical protein
VALVALVVLVVAILAEEAEVDQSVLVDKVGAVVVL